MPSVSLILLRLSRLSEPVKNLVDTKAGAIYRGNPANAGVTQLVECNLAKELIYLGRVAELGWHFACFFWFYIGIA